MCSNPKTLKLGIETCGRGRRRGDGDGDAIRVRERERQRERERERERPLSVSVSVSCVFLRFFKPFVLRSFGPKPKSEPPL